jgi:ABC-type multidrug transport system fused ATPase/permease subunit
LSIAANLFGVVQPVILAKIVNAAQAGGPDLVPHALFWCGVYGVNTMAFWVCHGPSRVIERRLAYSIYKNFVTSMYRKVTEMPLRWHQDHHTGDTINRVTKAGKALNKFAGEQFIQINIAVRFTGSLLFLAWFSWWVAATALVLSMAVYFIIRRYDRNLMPIVKLVNDREHKLTAGVYDYIGNIVTVLTLRLQRGTHREIRRRFLGMRHPVWVESPLTEWKWGTVNILLVLLQAGQVGLYIAKTLWSGKPLDLGAVVAIFQYQLMIMQIFFTGMMALDQLMRHHMDVLSVEPLLEDHKRMGVAVTEEKPRN